MPAEQDTPPPVAIVVSRYNHTVTTRLLEGAVGAYLGRAGARDNIGVFDAPGAFEIPVIAAGAARSGLYEGVCCLGCIVRGETPHDRHLAGAVATGLVEVSVQTGVPCAFGVLTVKRAEQAVARAGGPKGNKGAEAMEAVLDAIGARAAIRDAALANNPGAAYRLAPARDKTAGNA